MPPTGDSGVNELSDTRSSVSVSAKSMASRKVIRRPEYYACRGSSVMHQDSSTPSHQCHARSLRSWNNLSSCRDSIQSYTHRPVLCSLARVGWSGLHLPIPSRPFSARALTLMSSAFHIVLTHRSRNRVEGEQSKLSVIGRLYVSGKKYTGKDILASRGNFEGPTVRTGSR